MNKIFSKTKIFSDTTHQRLASCSRESDLTPFFGLVLHCLHSSWIKDWFGLSLVFIFDPKNVYIFVVVYPQISFFWGFQNTSHSNWFIPPSHLRSFGGQFWGINYIGLKKEFYSIPPVLKQISSFFDDFPHYTTKYLTYHRFTSHTTK